MSMSLSIRGYYGTENKEFKKHAEAVAFCVKNELSLPLETSEFFKGKVEGEDLEAYHREGWVGLISNGLEISLGLKGGISNRKVIDLKSLPKNLETIIVELN